MGDSCGNSQWLVISKRQSLDNYNAGGKEIITIALGNDRVISPLIIYWSSFFMPSGSSFYSENFKAGQPGGCYESIDKLRGNFCWAVNKKPA